LVWPPGWRISSGQALALLVTAVVVAGLLFAFVLPIRTYMGQRRSIGATQAQVKVLDQQNHRLAARVQQLGTDAEIERLAREQYGMVKPGEEPYAILPAPGSAPAALPSIVPATPPAPKAHPGWLRRLWGHVEFWK
jgi:cell division protein FtsB